MFWVSLVDYALGMNIPRVCIYVYTYANAMLSHFIRVRLCATP